MVLGNFQCQGILLIWMTVRQGLTLLAVAAGGVCLDIFFSHIVMSLFFLLLSGRQLDLDLNQLLQLCMAHTAGPIQRLGPLRCDLVIKLVSVLFGKCTTLVVKKC